jgi:hypothetical protein
MRDGVEMAPSWPSLVYTPVTHIKMLFGTYKDMKELPSLDLQISGINSNVFCHSICGTKYKMYIV